MCMRAYVYVWLVCVRVCGYAGVYEYIYIRVYVCVYGMVLDSNNRFIQNLDYLRQWYNG